jgi:hypothetical protein
LKRRLNRRNMRINLRDTKPMKRDLVYTTGELPTRPFDATRFLSPSPHQNRCRRPRVEKVGLIASTYLAGTNTRRVRLTDIPDPMMWLQERLGPLQIL